MTSTSPRTLRISPVSPIEIPRGLTPGMELYLLAKSIRPRPGADLGTRSCRNAGILQDENVFVDPRRVREYTKLEFLIDAILSFDAKDRPMVECDIQIPILGQDDLEYDVLVDYLEFVKTRPWKLPFAPASTQPYTQEYGNSYRGLVLNIAAAGSKTTDEIIVLARMRDISQPQCDELLLISISRNRGIAQRSRILTRITRDSDYDLDPIINVTCQDILRSALNTRPISNHDNIITIVDQHWPATSGIIVPRHSLVRITMMPNKWSDMIILDLSSPMADIVAKHTEHMITGNILRRFTINQLSFQELLLFAEIMQALQIQF